MPKRYVHDMLLALVVLAIAGSVTQDRPVPPDLGQFERGAHVRLRVEWAYPVMTCDLEVNVGSRAAEPQKRWVALACDGRKAHRKLTLNEGDELLRLARASRLYNMRGIGQDGRAGDLWLSTLTALDRGYIVKLVVSGNPEFGSGPQSLLMQFLQQLLVELRARVMPIPRGR